MSRKHKIGFLRKNFVSGCQISVFLLRSLYLALFCLLYLVAEPVGLSGIAADREVFQVLQGLLPPQLSPEEKRV